MLIDTHIHTAETSPCALTTASEAVALYQRAGYDGFVITDHMYPFILRGCRNEAWHEQVDFWLTGYRAAKMAARDNFAVFLGMEIRFASCHNDYLLFGLNEDFIYDNPNLHKYKTLQEFRPLADKNGILIVQAHPFRRGMTVVDPTLLDGMEILNANHENNNEFAKMWSEKYGLFPTAGTDYHEGDVRYGLRLERRVEDSKELAEILRQGEYSIVE